MFKKTSNTPLENQTVMSHKKAAQTTNVSHGNSARGNINQIQSIIAKQAASAQNITNKRQPCNTYTINRSSESSHVHIDSKWFKSLVHIVGSTEASLILSDCIIYHNNQYRSFTVHNEEKYGLLTSFMEIQRDYKTSYKRAKLVVQSLIDQDLIIEHTQGFVHNQRFYTPTIKALDIVKYLQFQTKNPPNHYSQSDEVPLSNGKGTSPYRQKTYKDKHKDKKNNNQERLYQEFSVDQNIINQVIVIFDFSKWGLGDFECESEISGMYTARQLQVIGLITLNSQTEIDCQRFIEQINDIDNRQKSPNFKVLTRLAYRNARTKQPEKEAKPTASGKAQTPVDCYSDFVSDDGSIPSAKTSNHSCLEDYSTSKVEHVTDQPALVGQSPQRSVIIDKDMSLPVLSIAPQHYQEQHQQDRNNRDIVHKNPTVAETQTANTPQHAPDSISSIDRLKHQAVGSPSNMLPISSKNVTEATSKDHAVESVTGIQSIKQQTQPKHPRSDLNKTFSDCLRQYTEHDKKLPETTLNALKTDKNTAMPRQAPAPNKLRSSAQFSGLEDITTADIQAMISARKAAEIDHGEFKTASTISLPQEHATTGAQQPISPNNLPLNAYQQSLLMAGLEAAGVDSEILIRTAACEVLKRQPDIEIKALLHAVIAKLVGQPLKKTPQVDTEAIPAHFKPAPSPQKPSITKTFDQQKLPTTYALEMPIIEKEVLRKNWTALADQSFHHEVLPECQKIALVAIIDYVKRQGITIGNDKEVYQWLYHMASNKDHYYSQATHFKHWCNIAINQLKKRRLSCPKGFRNWHKRINQTFGETEAITNLYGRRLC